jgi:hypothetical protein
MSNLVTVGRMSFTSPRSINIASVQDGSRNSVDRTINMSGTFVVDTVAAGKKLRDELVSMGNSNLIFPFTWTGDELIEGYCKLSNVTVDNTKLATGIFKYSVVLDVKGRTSEMLFESNMTGSLLTNSHSITTTSYSPWHALPVNGYNYYHAEAPTDALRASSEGNLTFFYDDNLRSSAAQFIVDPADYYKGAARILVDNTTMTGYLAKNSPTGVILSNGIIRLTSGNQASESRFTIEFYDNGSWSSSREISFNSGSSKTEWNVWKTVQILRNEPQECVVRFTTYSDSNGDGRLVVDATIRRGAHHIGLVANQGPTADRAASSRINLQVTTNHDTFTDDTGYMIEDTADSDGQKFIVGSPQGYTADVTDGEDLIHITNNQFKTFVGYVYNAVSPNTIDTADAVRDQYLEGLYENIRLVRA